MEYAAEQPQSKKYARKFKLGIVIPVVILVIFVVTGTLAQYLAPHNPVKINLANSLAPPFFASGGTLAYPLGTDLLGRDILSRIIFGARVSLIVGLAGVLASGLIGGTLGIIAGYYGGNIDRLISRAVDLTLGLPLILLALVLAVVFGASLFNVILIIVLLYWARYTRLARGETLKIREMDYVSLARTAGVPDQVIMFRHILPNVLNSLIVLATLNVGTVITLEASLSFLGAGIPPPTPSWGGMVSDGRGTLVTAWWVSFMPGLAITLVVLSGNMFGDWLRDKLDPKLRGL